MRIRTIKPELWTNPKIGRLKREERLLFIGLLNLADDQGVVLNNASFIKSQLFAYDKDLRETSVEAWLNSLCNARLIVPFEYRTEGYYIIRTFEKHQVINRPSKPKFPIELINNILENYSENTHGVLTEHSSPELGREGKGKEDINISLGENFVEISPDSAQNQFSDSLLPPEPKKKGKAPPSEDGEAFAKWFREQLPSEQRVNPTVLQKWAYAYDDMIRLDCRPPDQIRAVCEWGRKDNFWKSRLLSPAALRESNKSGVMKYDTILTQMKERNGNNTGIRVNQSGPTNPQSGGDPHDTQRRISEIFGLPPNAAIGNPTLALNPYSES